MADSPAARAETAATARAHAEGGRAGTLATISADPGTKGYPFGSVVPYALDDAGGPIVRIADIAQHTRNLKADPRASLLVRPEPTDGDPQATWRVTLVGRMEAREPRTGLEAARALDPRAVVGVRGAARVARARSRPPERQAWQQQASPGRRRARLG